MTLTAPGCSMGAMIASEIQDKLLGIPGCEEANVEMVWDPPWTPHMMSRRRARRSASTTIERTRLLQRQRSWIDQHARIENRVRVERALRRFQSPREALGPLAIVPRAMVAADRVMMRDRAAELHDHFRHRRLISSHCSSSEPRLPGARIV